MVTWAEFRSERPDLADAGRDLFYQFGVGLGFLGTVSRRGGPRVHPMCPIVTDDGLYALIIPSPKGNDLLRDGRYAMHCFPPADNEDAFSVDGRASRRDDADLRARIDALFMSERKMDTKPPDFDEQTLFEFDIDRCLLTRTKHHGDWDPQHTIWHASS